MSSKNDAMNIAAIRVSRKTLRSKREHGVFDKPAGLENLKASEHLQIITLKGWCRSAELPLDAPYAASPTLPAECPDQEWRSAKTDAEQDMGHEIRDRHQRDPCCHARIQEW
jgi:hypothetical protein